MGSELLDYHKEDNTMFFLLVFFVLHTAVTSGENCPEQKRVGDTCYTRVAMTDTHQYGCKENCTYKKTNSSDTKLYCFKTGSLQVTECGNFTGDNGECVTPFRPGPGPNGPNSLCYYFSNTLVNSWEDAENRCQSMSSGSSGSYLAFIETQAQQDFIVKVLDATTSDRAFIGGTSINNTDLTFYWLFTSTAVDDGFTFWGPREPNYKEEQCMEMNNEKGKYPEPWMWNNIGCGAAKYAKHSYVCVYDLIRGSSSRGSSIRGSSIHG